MPTSGGGFEQRYNAQAAVDVDSQLIVAADFSNNPADYQNLVPLAMQVLLNTHHEPQMILADTGCAS